MAASNRRPARRSSSGVRRAARSKALAAAAWPPRSRRVRGLLEHSSDGFVRRDRRGREMPCPPVHGPRPPAADRPGERPMGGSARLARRGVVDGRAKQRMAKLEPEVVDPDDVRRLGLLQRRELQAERAGGPRQLAHLSRIARRGEHQRAPRLLRQVGDTPEKRSLDERGGGQLVAQGLEPGELIL